MAIMSKVKNKTENLAKFATHIIDYRLLEI